MDSLYDIWRSVMERLADELNSTIVNTWFSECEPLALGERCLVLQTSSRFIRDVIRRRFADTIRKIMQELLGCEFKLVVLARDEIEQQQITTAENGLPEAREHTFDQFVAGQSNELAHAAAVSVSENLGKAYNPLFIYGAPGLGKTHLLLSIGYAVQERNPAVRLCYIKGEEFTDQMICAIRENTLGMFRKRYRTADLLLVDDIDCVSGKWAVQEELLGAFRAVCEAGGQIVAAASLPVRDVERLNERLRSRFEGGIMVELQPPDEKTREAIIWAQSEAAGVELPDGAVEYMTKRLTENVVQIKGVIHQLIAYRDLLGAAITLELVKRVVADVVGAESTPEEITEEVSCYFGIPVADIITGSKDKTVIMARKISFFLLRELANMGLIDTREYLGMRMGGGFLVEFMEGIERMVETDPDMAVAVRDIISNLNSRKQV